MSMRRWRRSPHLVVVVLVAPEAGVVALAGKWTRPVVVVVVDSAARNSNGV
jgi:hypothetical protein